MTIEVDLWLWPLAMPAIELEICRDLLSADETARALRFVYPRDRDGFIAGRGRLRQILGSYADQPPASLRFDYNAFGKPKLAHPGAPRFNLSHSGGLAALAVSPHADLGIDIERQKPIEKAIARRFFSPAENAELNALATADWQGGFYRCWTRKEAFVKACGQGLSLPLGSFDVTLAPSAPPRLLRHEGGRAGDWTLIHLDPASNITGAIAVRSCGAAVELVTKAQKF